ncbi:MAG TPA: hypothetical protein VHX38_00790 [Pseudonocardiaceae bacterium]|jgi:hypothetical protein|nr:hypothetical protein [Pseudonocardiaceae bacterium]
MRRLGIVLGTAALVLLAAGCAGRAASDDAAGQASSLPAANAPGSTRAAPGPAAPDLPSVHLPPGSEPVAGAKVDASALPAGYPRLVWTVGNGGTLGFFTEQGACQTVSAQVIAQTATAVTIRLLQIQPASTKPCPHSLLNKPTTVGLSQPLGSRTVIMQATIERG